MRTPAHNRKFLAGRRFNRLLVLEDLPSRRTKGGHNIARVRCKCDCGNTTEVDAANVTTQRQVSCGCWKDSRPGTRTRHGEARSGSITPEYRCWTHLISRCTNPNNKAWKHYGGRGITVCKRWGNSFEAFLEDMGRRPSSCNSIDRIDNEKGYRASNCRWSNPKEQSNNSRRNLRVTHKGRTMNIAQWARETGIHPATLYRRYHAGEPPSKVLAT